MTKLENVGVVCSQNPADADHMISNTALTAARLLDKSVVLVGNDTDLLVMLIAKAIPLLDIYMQFSLHLTTIFHIHEIQNDLHINVRKHILFAHTFTGSDTVSTSHNMGKRKALSILANRIIDWDMLNVFVDLNAKKDDTTRQMKFSC